MLTRALAAIEGKPATSELAASYHELIFELNKAAPAVLNSVLPNLERELNVCLHSVSACACACVIACVRACAGRGLQAARARGAAAGAHVRSQGWRVGRQLPTILLCVWWGVGVLCAVCVDD
jgi:hypothetical protein